MIDWLRMIEEGEKALTIKGSPPYKLFCDKTGTPYHLNNMVCKEHKKCMLLILTSEEVLIGLSQPEDSSVITLILTSLEDLHSH